MKKTLFSLAGLLLVLSGTPFAADEFTDWTNTTTNPEIQYRTQVYESSKTCFLEFRDKQQGDGPTTFDAEVDYKSKDPQHNNEMVDRTDRENIVTTSSHNGGSRIANCFGVMAVRLNLVQRH
jgi:hypothetical protein